MKRQTEILVRISGPADCRTRYFNDRVTAETVAEHLVGLGLVQTVSVYERDTFADAVLFEVDSDGIPRRSERTLRRVYL